MLSCKVVFVAATLFVVNLNFNEVNSQTLCDHRYLNDAIRINGQVVIITGGTSGLGYHTALNLANRGGRIYLAARGAEKGAEAVKTITQTTGNMNVKFLQLDLGSLKSIRQFSKAFHASENRLDILINNAGVASDFSRTEDGFEMNMGVNHLGHFLLTNLLLDLLKSSAPSRIVVVSSLAHYVGAIVPYNFNSQIYFPGIIRAYGNSKQANILFARELSKRLENTGVTVNSLDPGFSKSGLGSNLQPNLRILFELLQQLVARESDYATQTHIMLAVDPSVKYVSGKYFKDCVQQEPNSLARNENMARWLWDESAKLTKLYERQRKYGNFIK